MPTDSWFKCNTRISLLGLIVATILPLASFSAQAQQPIFPVTTFAPAVAGTVFATGNFDGKGPELAFVPSDATIDVLLTPVGAASPIVATTSSLVSTCTSVTALVAADMNNDHILDLVAECVTSSGNSIAVLLGIGNGTFQPPVYYQVSGLQSLAQPVDLNGDGFPDIVVATSGGIAVLLNQGTAAPGQLAAPVPYNTPFPSATPLIGDFNGDGKQDILIGSTQLAVFYGNGDGTLKPAQTIPIPSTIALGSFIAADVNNDGITDIAYIAIDPTFKTPTTLQVLLGATSGTFTTGSATPLYFITNTFSFSTLTAFESTTSSNTTDIAVTGTGTAILIGNGSGGFTPSQTFMLSGQVIPQPSSTGSTDLLVNNAAGMVVLPGNGDGTFQGVPAATNGGFAFTAIDVNGDGITDILSIGENTNLITQLGRGNGTFSTIPPTAALVGNTLAAGNFTSDSIPDVAAIRNPQTAPLDATLFLYKGNGDGTFQPSTTGVDLKVVGAQSAITGDFNGDGKLDLIVYYADLSNAVTGLVFVPGNGDGTFGTPVAVAQQGLVNGAGGGPVLAADLTNNNILDLIWNGAVYLGNGNGTFTPQPLNLTGTPLAIADLNGDGIADVVIGTSVYAGNGTGTFQTSPFFTATLPTGATPTAAAVGDLNADNHADLLLAYTESTGITGVAIAFGSAAGTLTPDPNTYYTGTPDVLGAPVIAVARSNNKAPALSTENTWDLLSNNGGLAASLLNQLNPVPTAPSALPSRTVLTASATSAGTNQQLTFTATVTILNPTGTVTFTSGTTTLGTATLTNGVATLPPYAFTTAGSYPVTAAYAGDINNLPSSSTAVTITVTAPIAPDFTGSASPTTATITAGQSATTTLSVTPVGGFTSTVTFACGTLPTGAACTFSPAAVTPANGAASTSTLTVTTTARTSALLKDLTRPLQGIAWASLVLLAFTPRRTRTISRRLLHTGLLTLLLLTGLISLSGCGGGSSPPTPPSNPGTPAGTYSINVTASSGALAHPITFQVIVQ
jgi:Bacterial Ig-like domain (group 3)/FG-GAP-like repeat